VANVHARTLQRAAEIAGGEEKLALRLSVTPSHLALWIKGMAEPPAHVFLEAVDLVLERDVRELSKGGMHPSDNKVQETDAPSTASTNRF
jgi:DNA-binding transcriptional regulator YdaS (Cro superfamily)